MRSWIPLLLARTAIWALPSPYSHLTARAPLTSTDPLTLTQPFNTTAPDWPVICYHQIPFVPANRQTCHPLIMYLASRRDFGLPKRWLPGPVEPEWSLAGCKLSIVSGSHVSDFSMRDVVSEMMRVLEVCQPPRYLGMGGLAPVQGRAGFMYEAFHVQVMGMAS